jgi:acylphosphatase
MERVEQVTPGVHIIVEGLVQGIGYRWFVARKAEALGIGGMARNLDDGSVEIHAAGERPLLEEFIRHLNVGPRAAHVTRMKIEWQEEPDFSFQSFRIR